MVLPIPVPSSNGIKGSELLFIPLKPPKGDSVEDNMNKGRRFAKLPEDTPLLCIGEGYNIPVRSGARY